MFMRLIPKDRKMRVIVILQCHSPKEKTSWLPRKCFVTGKSLFMKPSIKVRRDVRRGDSYTIKQFFWVAATEFLLIQMGKQ
jgi:hypothetical protein